MPLSVNEQQQLNESYFNFEEIGLFLENRDRSSSVTSVPLKFRIYSYKIFSLKKYLENPRGVKLMHPEKSILLMALSTISLEDRVQSMGSLKVVECKERVCKLSILLSLRKLSNMLQLILWHMPILRSSILLKL